MKYILMLTVLLGIVCLGDEVKINKYLYYSDDTLSEIDASCKKNSDCLLTRDIYRGCSHIVSVNKKITQKDIVKFNGEESVFWITKDVECVYPKDEYLESLVAVCKEGVCSATKSIKNLKYESLEWKELKHNLWEDRHGNIGLKTFKALSESAIVDRYIITMGAERKKLKDILDINTFESINNSSYYKDKNHVYIHYAMSDGGWFGILEGADSTTFRNIGSSIYFKDKEYVYVERNGKIDVDYDTFEAFETAGDVCCYAKDKHAYYAWGEKVTNTKSSEFLEIKKILDRQSVAKRKRLPECTPEIIRQHEEEEMRRYGREKKLTSHPPCVTTLKAIK